MLLLMAPPRKLSAPVTMAQLADELGLSLMTVSRALRGLNVVSKRTRERVTECARRMGYSPNPALSALVAYRQSVRPPSGYSQLAFVTNFSQRNASRWAYARAFHEGAVERGREFGYEVVEFALREHGHSQKQASSILYNRGIRGLIIAPLTSANAHLNLTWNLFASVAIGYSLARPRLHYVSFDQSYAVKAVLHLLRGRGYLRIGFVYRPAESKRYRHAALDAFMGEQSRFPRGSDIPPFRVEDQDARILFSEWYRKYRPDVVVSSADFAIRLLNEREWQERKPFGIVCPSRFVSHPPELSGVVQDLRDIGAMAVDRLHAQLMRNELGIPEQPQGTLLEGTWWEGSTIRSPTTLRVSKTNA